MSKGGSGSICFVMMLGLNQSEQYQTVRRQSEYLRLNAADTFMEFMISGTNGVMGLYD